MNRIVWHYTTGEKFTSIVNDGQLLTASASALIGEKPILWFSAHPYWKPTACKAIRENGRIRRLSMKETWQLGKGLVRFGIDRNKLHPWPKIGIEAHISRKQRKVMESTGRKQGANPAYWYGTTMIMDLEKIPTIQVINESGEWVEALNVP